MTNFDKCMSAWLLCCASIFTFMGGDEWVNGDNTIAVLFLFLSVAFIAAGSYRMFYPRKVR